MITLFTTSGNVSLDVVSNTRESAVSTEQRCPCTFFRLCPNQPATLRSALLTFSPASEDCSFGAATALFLLRWSHAPLARYGVPIPPSASPGSDTVVARPGSVLRSSVSSGSSMAVTSSGYLSPLHMMYALNLKYHSCDFVSSLRKTGGFPSCASRRFVVGCGPATAAAALACWSLCTCAVSSPILVLSAHRFFAGFHLWPPRSSSGPMTVFSIGAQLSPTQRRGGVPSTHGTRINAQAPLLY